MIFVYALLLLNFSYAERSMQDIEKFRSDCNTAFKFLDEEDSISIRPSSRTKYFCLCLQKVIESGTGEYNKKTIEDELLNDENNRQTKKCIETYKTKEQN